MEKWLTENLRFHNDGNVNNLCDIFVERKQNNREGASFW